MRRHLLTLLFAASALRLAAQGPAIPQEELLRDPSPERIETLLATAAQRGWGANVEPLRQAMFGVYERQPAVAAPWLSLYRWATLWAVPQRQAITDWIRAVEAAKVAHPNMAAHYLNPPGALGGLCSVELQRFVLTHPAFSDEFFHTLDPVDQPVEVLRTLQALFAADPALFADFSSLALAIAVVYDVPPPPDWPHGQVSAALLPRRFPLPSDAFHYWVRLDQLNLTAHRLRRLPASELKFVVDTVTPFSELTWAQRHVTPPLAQLAQAYDMVKYRKDRLAQNVYDWRSQDYRLETIWRTGGICVDQAYFAVNAGKARGVPTLCFRGAGLDGRHAWFGFLSPTGWVLDAGRYAEQKFVAGLAYDPQTWRNFTDHELLFLTQRFHLLPLYKLSTLHADMAQEYLRAGQGAAAQTAAREAVNRERRNLAGWQVLLSAARANQAGARAIEAILHEAATAFAQFPDLEAAFGRQYIASLRARGESSLADAEEQKLAHKYQAGRADLSVQTAVDMLERSMREEELPARIKTYNRVLDAYGRGAGVDFFDRVVVRFVRHLQAQGQLPAALQALDRARNTLRVEKGSQLDQELASFRERIKLNR